jgi:tetratricopeptide (TPR) repeat protein
LEAIQKGHAIVERLTKGNPKVTYYQIQLAASQQKLGEAWRTSGQSAKALASFEQARGTLGELVRLQPALHFQRAELAVCESEIARLYRDSGRNSEALVCYEHARAIQAALTKSNPDQLDYRSSLGSTEADLGLLLADLGRAEEALAMLRRAIENQQVASSKAPQVPRYRERLRTHYRALGSLLRKLGRPVDAVALTLERRSIWLDDPKELYDVACEFAQAAAIAGKEESQLKADEHAESRKYYDLALETLRQALACGFRDAERLEKDADLEPLRSGSEFKQLVAELSGKIKNGK